MGITYLWLWVADHNLSDRRHRVIQLGDTFASTLKLVDNGQAYDWDYADPILPSDYYATGAEDTSHGNIDVLFATGDFQHGLVFTATDMTRFANTFTNVMWNQSTTTPIVSASVNGSGTTSSTLILYGWAGLMPYSRLDSLAWVITDAVYNHNRVRWGRWAGCSTQSPRSWNSDMPRKDAGSQAPGWSLVTTDAQTSGPVGQSLLEED